MFILRFHTNVLPENSTSWNWKKCTDGVHDGTQTNPHSNGNEQLTNSTSEDLIQTWNDSESPSEGPGVPGSGPLHQRPQSLERLDGTARATPSTSNALKAHDLSQTIPPQEFIVLFLRQRLKTGVQSTTEFKDYSCYATAGFKFAWESILCPIR